MGSKYPTLALYHAKSPRSQSNGRARYTMALLRLFAVVP